MAAESFKFLSEYDAKIFKWINKNQSNKNIYKLRYGENQNQKA